MTQTSTNIAFPDAVFWDWDGTIADSYGFLNDAHNHTLETLGFPRFKDGEYQQYFGKPREMLYPAIYKEKCDDAMEIFQDYVFANSHKVQIIPGSQDVLEFLKSRNVAMGIVSNKKREFVKKEVEHAGFDDFFSIIIGSGDAQEDKPSGAPLILALEREGISYKEQNIWYVGDTENDLACTKNVGCQAIFLKGREDSKELIEKYNPLLSIDNYGELKEFLVSL